MNEQRFLMMTVSSCPDCEDTATPFCPRCEYAYWGTGDIASNPDNGHFSGYTEKKARTLPELKEAVQSADNY